MTALIYRLLLRALPREFRERFGAEMEEAFAAALGLARPGWGRLAPVAVVARAALDVAVLAYRLRRPRGARPGLTGLGAETRFAARRLRRTPAITFASVATLGLGIGATVVMLTVVGAVLVRPLPYGEPQNLVAVFLHEKDHDARRAPTSPASFHAWREESESLELWTAAHPWSPSLTEDDRPEEVHGLRVSSTVFDLLGVPPHLGRGLDASDVRAVVLGYDLFRDRFGLDPRVVGRRLTLDGERYDVVGVMPEGFRFPPFWAAEARFWAPLTFSPEEAAGHSRYLRAFARLRDGASIEQARVEMDAIGARLLARFPDRNAGTGVNVEPLLEPVVEAARPVLLLLLAAVGLVLLTASANVANLQLVRVEARAREIALETALGAGRMHLVRERVAESLLVALAGGTVGGLLATWSVPLLVAVAPAGAPRLEEIRVDPALLGVALVVAVAVALAVGVLIRPCGFSANVAARLREGGPRAGDRGGKRVRDALIVWQLASALVLLVGASLVVRSFFELRNVDPGFRRERVLTASLLLAGSQHAPFEKQTTLFRRVREAVAAVPGVTSAALVNHLPIGGDSWGLTFLVEGALQPEGERPRASQRTVSTGYFATMGVPLLAGRPFAERDDGNGQRVVVVNETLARRYGSVPEIVGRRIAIGGPSAFDWRTVVGVVGDSKQWDLTQTVDPEIYFPYAQNPSSSYLRSTLVVASELPAERLRGEIEQAVWSVAGEIPVANVHTMEQILADHVAPERFAAILFAIFAALSLLLSAVGLYGVLSFGVTRQTAELGIRSALGATRRDLGALVVARGARLVAAGLALGLVVSLLLGRLASGLLYGVRAQDPWTLAASAAFLAAAAALAIGLPARRAAKLDPIQALGDGG